MFFNNSDGLEFSLSSQIIMFLIFDHGHGISTLYMHLKDIYVSKGQKVKQGEIIGTLGQSGRATGPHLDIRLNWFGTRIDPMTAIKK